jgi:DNA-binding response OmpR family regulator
MRNLYIQNSLERNTAAKQSRRVLLVEDDCNIKMVYQFFLRKLGFEVCAVSTAREALLRTQQEIYDIMILDLGLPDASGETVISSIREREKGITLNRLPIIVITAHGDDIITTSCLRKGADDVFIKPVSLDKFKHSLNTL